jgi:3-phosphoshikimate 1-carboxyvinyltransferase
VPSLTALPSEALAGVAKVPGDKSISHRAIILGGLAVGESQIEGLLEGEDVLRTVAAMKALGAEISRGDDGVWRICGRGIGALTEPEDILDMGNSGTAARLLTGVLASHPLTAVMTGDASMRRRPMSRVITPLTETGARFFSRAGGRLPLTVVGTGTAMPLDYRLPVASAQVKSAILLAGLNAPGETRVVEPQPTRDHSEIMLRHFGAEVRVEPAEDGGGDGRCITLNGQPELVGRRLRVPGDPSSAAFLLVAALILPGSELSLPGVGVNRLRSGLITTLQEMGADISFENQREEGGEQVADLLVRASRLQGIEVPAARAPSMIDEYPILAVAAALASGRTVMRGLAELKVKESDRLALMADGLAACGVEVEAGADSLSVTGQGHNKRPRGGAEIATRLDHRIAMSFLVLGLASEQAITIDDDAPIATSFPGFAKTISALGGRIRAGALASEAVAAT